MSLIKAFENLERATEELTMVMDDYTAVLRNNLNPSSTTKDEPVVDHTKPDGIDDTPTTEEPPKKKRTRRNKEQIAADKAAKETTAVEEPASLEEPAVEEPASLEEPAVEEPASLEEPTPEEKISQFTAVKTRLQEICKLSPATAEEVRGAMSALGFEKLSAIPHDKYDALLATCEAVYTKNADAVDNTPPDDILG